MLTAWVWTSAVFSCLILHNAIAQSQMCAEPFQAVITLVTNVTIPTSANLVDSDLVFYRKVMRYTEEEIDRDTEAALRFFRDTFGLDFTNIEPNEQLQRTLGNATFEPDILPFNYTFVSNSWLVNGKTRTRCFPVGTGGGYRVRFTGTMMLHGSYGGDDGALAVEPDIVFYDHLFVYDACKQQGIVFLVESLAPFGNLEGDPGGFVVYNFRVRNRVLGEGTGWGVGRITRVNSTTRRFESRHVYTFL